MFTVHVEFADHVHDFEVKDNGRSRDERARSLCTLVGGISWEVWA